MDKNFNLTDIGNVIMQSLDNPVAKTIRTGVIGTIGIVNPWAAVAAEVGNTVLSEYNTFKFSLLLQGLSSGLNIEKRLNDLYNYVKSGPEKAIIVSNLFRQTINAECPKVSIIYGIILGNHVDDHSPFCHAELIICKALENATDYDMNNFKQIMENYLKPTPNGERISFPKGCPLLDEFTSTCDWAVYNRIFTSQIGAWDELEEGNLSLDTCYYVASPARVLLDYINMSRQIWDYSGSI